MTAPGPTPPPPPGPDALIGPGPAASGHPSALPPPPSGFQGRFLGASDDLEPWAVASGPYRFTPWAVARPASDSDVSRLVTWGGREGIALVPRGAGTGMPGHNVGRGVVVDLAGLDAVGAVDVEAGHVRVGPGAVAAAVAGAAEAEGLYLPPLPSSADRCTVGGMVANNAAGARSFLHGSVRSWVEELTVVLSDGSTVTLGPGRELPPLLQDLHRDLTGAVGSSPSPWPDVRKNSSGYALDHFLPERDGRQLLVGSEGTLGIVTSILLRLIPRPADRAVVLLGLPELQALPEIAIRAEDVGASACEYFGRRILEMADLAHDSEIGPLARGAEGLVLLEVEGSREEVETGVGELRTLAGALATGWIEARDPVDRERLWHVRHRTSPTIAKAAERGLVSTQFIEDCVVPPANLPQFVRELRVILEEAHTDAVLFGHAGDGNLHVNPLLDMESRGWRERTRWILEETVELVAALGGTLSGEHGDGRVRAPYLERIWGRRMSDAFCRIKKRLDPDGILNPGVVISLPGQDPLEGLVGRR